MIIADNPSQLICPRCHRSKYILMLISGNGCGGQVWSDGRAYYPMMQSCSMNFLREKFNTYEEGEEDYVEWKMGLTDGGPPPDEDEIESWRKRFRQYWEQEDLDAIYW